MALIQGIGSAGSIPGTGSANGGLRPYLAVETPAAQDFRRARTRLLALYRQLEGLADVAGVDTRFITDRPGAQSANAIALDLTSTAAFLASTDEINASPMSFSPFGPDWTDGSSALITIGGEYDGSHGTGDLSFEVRRAGTRGVDDLRIRVDDPQGSRIRNINIRSGHALDRQYDLRNGLFLTLGSGDLINRDTTTTQVFDSLGSVVDPGKSLGGLRNNNPNLQFGTPSIVDGNFQLNGQNISVVTTDTINDVINRINQSSSGVTANFNAATERIEFLQDTEGSAYDVDLQGDTSNFLAATKLDSATVTPGIDPESEQAFDLVPAFASVGSGSIVVNGESIDVDTASDSLLTVIDKINNSAANVSASFDTQTQRVSIESLDSEADLVLDSNGTNFFNAIALLDGRTPPTVVAHGVSRKRSYEIADSIAGVYKELNALFRDSNFAGGASNAGIFRAPLESAIRSAFGGDLSGSLFGLQVDGSPDARRRGDFAEVDRTVLTRSLRFRGDEVQALLSGIDGEGGYIDGLLLATRQALSLTNSALGLSGSVIDTYA